MASNARRRRSAAEVVPPHDLSLEKGALGAMLVWSDVAVSGIERLRVEDFYRDVHQIVFRMIAQLISQGQQVDFLVVKAALQHAGQLDVVGAPYLLSLTNGALRPSSLAGFAHALRELSVRRAIQRVGAEIAERATDMSETASEILQQADRALSHAGQARQGSPLRSMSDLIDPLMDNLQARVQSGGVGVPSGFAIVDKLTTGWQPGDFIVIAGRPSQGKTAIGLNMTVAAARAKTAVAIFSLEMRAQPIQYRMLSAMSAVPMFRLFRGDLRDADWTRLSTAMNELGQLPIYLDDTPGLSGLDLRAKLRHLKSQHGPIGLVVVDYVQLMACSPQTARENRTAQVTEISQRLKQTAREFDVPLIALCQLSRAVEHRQNRRPQLSDLRETGALEQDADIVGLLYQKQEHQPATDQVTQFVIEKSRNGPTGEVALTFDKVTQLFRETVEHLD